MKKFIFFLSTVCIIIALESCKKKPILEETYWDKVRANQQKCIDGFKASIKCNGISPNAKSYFSANIAGNDVCFEEDKNDYVRFAETGLFGISNGTTVLTSNLNNLLMFGLRPKSFQAKEDLLRFEVRLLTNEALSTEQLLDKYLVIGDVKMFDDSLRNDRFGSEGFFLEFVNTCTPETKGDSTWSIIEWTGHKTHPESFIRCNAFTKAIGPTSITYDMTFSFEFRLGNFVFDEKWLRNGKFRTQLEIPL